MGGPRLFAVMLPALLSSGIGALVFTGLGRWTGLATGNLSLKLSAPLPAWTSPTCSGHHGVALAAVLHPLLAGARLIASYVAARPLARTVLCALGAAACAALYALITDRSPVQVASSGQATLAALAADPHAWGVGALLAVLLFKGAASRSASAACAAAPCSPLSSSAPRWASCSDRCRGWTSYRPWRRAWPRPRPSRCGCR